MPYNMYMKAKEYKKFIEEKPALLEDNGFMLFSMFYKELTELKNKRETFQNNFEDFLKEFDLMDYDISKFRELNQKGNSLNNTTGNILKEDWFRKIFSEFVLTFYKNNKTHASENMKNHYLVADRKTLSYNIFSWLDYLGV